jgi:phosphoribosylaminoimidazole (AIR) synthetase
VVRGRGTDAPLVEVERGVYVSFKIESHNHPSAVDPYNGAATGVGGIIRDILTVGAVPVALLVNLHFGPPDDPHARWIMDNVVRGIADYGNRLGVPVVGGETWFDEDFTYTPIVLATCVGVVEKDAVLPGVVFGVDVVCTVLATRVVKTRPPQPGDVLIGLPSTGPHANGYSLLRRLFKPGEEVCGARVADLLLAEVADYSRVLEAMKNGAVAGAVHITGGAYKKLKKALGDRGAELNFEVPCIFKEVIKRGVDAAEAYRVFNMGMGMVVYADKNNVEHALALLEPLNPKIIGQVKDTGPLVVNGIEIH